LPLNEPLTSMPITSVDLATRAPSAVGTHATAATLSENAASAEPKPLREILITLPSAGDRAA
jgi:hypothetical protein